MLRSNAKLNTKGMSEVETIIEYNDKLVRYITVEKDLNKYYECSISQCISIPIDGIHFLIKIEGIDKESGIANFNLLGYTTSSLFSLEDVELSEVVVDNEKIVIFNYLMRLGDRDGIFFNNSSFSSTIYESINRTSISVLNYYLCQKFVCEDYDHALLNAEFSLED